MKYLNKIGFGYQPRASYAQNPELTRGRVYREEGSPTRAPYQRDRDRIIHSTAFRRLKHKTQVFFSQEADLYRTRLTHSIEVSQIARAIARSLRLDEELTEALALAHDFGHTPFGHAGERALQRCMENHGGFDHNAQSLRIVAQLEHRYAAFNGLNLTFETLDGLIKHNGPLKNAIPYDISDFASQHQINLALHASLEAQAAAIADDIAYNAHDLDDGLHSGLLTLHQIEDAPLASQLLEEVRRKYPDLSAKRSAYEITRRQITRMVEDVVTNAIKNIETLKPNTVYDVEMAGKPMVTFSQTMQNQERGLKSFMFAHLYRHETVMETMTAAEIVIEKLFDAYLNKPDLLTEDWRERASAKEPLAIHIKDFIAGMTDRHALREHKRIFGDIPRCFHFS